MLSTSCILIYLKKFISKSCQHPDLYSSTDLTEYLKRHVEEQSRKILRQYFSHGGRRKWSLYIELVGEREWRSHVWHGA